MSEDDHTNGAMETNENSDSNENSVRNIFFFVCIVQSKFSIHFMFMFVWCVEHSLLFRSLLLLIRFVLRANRIHV